MSRMRVLCLMLVLALVLCGCGGDPKENSSVTITDSESCFFTITLEGEGVSQAVVMVFPMTKGENGSYTDEEGLKPVFDGVDTWYLATETGGEYVVQVYLSDERVIHCYALMDETRVCSFHVDLDAKEDTGYRHLWPETPHNNPE